MPSERMQRRIDALLDQTDEAVNVSDWGAVAEKARAVIAIDQTNEDALSFLKMAEANGVARTSGSQSESTVPAQAMATSRSRVVSRAR